MHQGCFPSEQICIYFFWALENANDINSVPYLGSQLNINILGLISVSHWLTMTQYQDFSDFIGIYFQVNCTLLSVCLFSSYHSWFYLWRQLIFFLLLFNFSFLFLFLLFAYHFSLSCPFISSRNQRANTHSLLFIIPVMKKIIYIIMQKFIFQF